MSKATLQYSLVREDETIPLTANYTMTFDPATEDYEVEVDETLDPDGVEVELTESESEALCEYIFNEHDYEAAEQQEEEEEAADDTEAEDNEEEADDQIG